MLTKKRTILITGISRGIGLSLAQVLINNGDRVIGIGRTGFAQINIKGMNPQDYFRCDLSKPSDISTIVQRLKLNVLKLDFVIYNAALGFYGAIEEQCELNKLVRTNILAPIMLTRYLSDILLASCTRLVFISSVHSLLPTANFSAYTASKRAVEGFARSLREEWSGKVEVQVLYVGPTATNLHIDAGVPIDKSSKIKCADPSIVAAKIMKSLNYSARWKALNFKDSVLRMVSYLLVPIIDYGITRGVR